MVEQREPCAHEDQADHRFCAECGQRLVNAATRRQSFRDRLEKKSS